MEKAWYVYLVECADGSLYCGMTTEPDRRVDQHNGLLAGGARYTRSRRPVHLAALASCPDRSSAARLESAIQNSPRHKKMARLLAAAMRTREQES